MDLLHIAYERIMSAVHNESTMDLYYTQGRRLGRLLYEGRWYDPEAMLLKEGLIHWVSNAISGSVTLELRRGEDYSIKNTEADFAAYHPEKLSMEKTESAFTPLDRIGDLEMQNISIMDNRELLVRLLKAKGHQTSSAYLHNSGIQGKMDSKTLSDRSIMHLPLNIGK
jgi:argininosuccinate synthase